MAFEFREEVFMLIDDTANNLQILLDDIKAITIKSIFLCEIFFWDDYFH